jgi:hypothetical protein
LELTGKLGEAQRLSMISHDGVEHSRCPAYRRHQVSFVKTFDVEIYTALWG